MGDYDKDANPATRSEFLVGALKASNPLLNMPTACSNDPQGGRISGRVYVLSVGPGAGSPTVQAFYRGEQGQGTGRMRLGTTVGVGDFDGDGHVDVIAGGSGYATASISEVGRVYIFENALAP